MFPNNNDKDKKKGGDEHQIPGSNSMEDKAARDRKKMFVIDQPDVNMAEEEKKAPAENGAILPLQQAPEPRISDVPIEGDEEKELRKQLMSASKGKAAIKPVRISLREMQEFQVQYPQQSALMAVASPSAMHNRGVNLIVGNPRQRFPQVRQAVEQDFVQENPVAGGDKGFNAFKNNYPDLIPSSMTQDDWRSLVQCVKMGLGLVGQTNRPNIVFNNRAKNPKDYVNKKRMLYENEQFRQLSKLCMNWLNDGS